MCTFRIGDTATIDSMNHMRALTTTTLNNKVYRSMKASFETLEI